MQPKILLVESDRLLQKLYTTKLEQECRVFPVMRAQDAMDVLDDDSDSEVSVILMDIQVDANNGIELLHEIRSYDDWLDVPVLFLSSLPLSKLPIEKLKRYGVVKVLYKPQITPKSLLVETMRIVREHSE